MSLFLALTKLTHLASVFSVDSEHDAGRLVLFLEFRFCFGMKRRLRTLGRNLKLLTYIQASKMNPTGSEIHFVFLIRRGNL